MRILALEPYYGGSHRAFLDGWRGRSRHEFTVLGLPPRVWKWRMRHAAVTLAEQVRQLAGGGESWDLLFCSDMLDLAEFRGLCPGPVVQLPAVAYFHENQLTYPVRAADERDLHFAYTNFTTCLAADAVWFNTAFHRDDFLAALNAMLRRMPDYRQLEQSAAIAGKSSIEPPGVEAFPTRAARASGPLRILWAARWEHDKNPEDFFAALDCLLAGGVDFRVSVIGEQFRDAPPVFGEYRRRLDDRIDHWGFQATRDAYRAALLAADVFVSTAKHEFFGITAVEAMAAGCFPLLPRRLTYPELLQGVNDPDSFLYDGTARDLARRLRRLARRIDTEQRLDDQLGNVRWAMRRYDWDRRASEMDARLESVSSLIQRP